MADQDNDSLGLDKPIKLGRVSRIAKLTDELLFDRNRGLPPVIANYPKLSRTIKRNDQKLGEKLKKGAYSKLAAHLMKVETEVKNLESVLQFYQLWCHGLFPRATFADCVKMLRTHKSLRLKEYRRELISQQIHRLKVEKGLIIEERDPSDAISDDDLYQPHNDIAALDVAESTALPNATGEEDDEDDWGFLSVPRRSNELFIGDEDDEESSQALTPKSQHTEAASKLTTQISENGSQLQTVPSGSTSQAPPTNSLHEDDFPEEFIDADDKDDQYDDEYEIMRQMGM